MPGPIIAKSDFFLLQLKNHLSVSENNSLSGFSINAYLVFTSLSPILFALP